MSEKWTFPLPRWMRIVTLGFAALFAYLAYWLPGQVEQSGPLAKVGAGIAGILAVVLLIGAVRGKLWKWVWFIPGW